MFPQQSVCIHAAFYSGHKHFDSFQQHLLDHPSLPLLQYHHYPPGNGAECLAAGHWGYSQNTTFVFVRLVFFLLVCVLASLFFTSVLLVISWHRHSTAVTSTGTHVHCIVFFIAFTTNSELQ